MGNAPLPEPLQNDEWKLKLKNMHSVSGMLSFSDLVDLVRTAPALRVAFDTDWQVGINRMAKVNFYKANTFRLHGIRPFHIDHPYDVPKGMSLESISEESLVDADVWDGFSTAVSEIIRDNLPLLPASRLWASEVVSGERNRPKVKPGPHSLKHDARDTSVVSFLFELEQVGIQITENEATKNGKSACHAISEGLSGYYTVPSPKSLMNIWSSRSQNWRDISRSE